MELLIVDDHGIIRSGIELIISQVDDINIISQASNGHEGILLSRKLEPDIVLMDITMPNLNGIDATKEILRENPNIKIITLSAHCNSRYISQMIKAGISGYILKDVLADELVKAIRVVYSGKRYFSEKVAELIIDNYAHGLSAESNLGPTDKLTTRERELLQLIAENKTTKEAAKILHLSVKTIEARRLNVMKKLKASGIAELTKIAIREGLTNINN